MPKKAKDMGGRGGVAKKKKKDPKAPKRGLSAYMFFANDQRDAVRAENPGISFGSVGKALGQKWKELSDKERKPYEERAQKDKERYETEKKSWQETADE